VACSTPISLAAASASLVVRILLTEMSSSVDVVFGAVRMANFPPNSQPRQGSDRDRDKLADVNKRQQLIGLRGARSYRFNYYWNNSPTLTVFCPPAMYESDSDWTEKEDDEYKASAGTRPTKAGPSPQKSGGYRIKNVLKVPRPTTYTTQAIYGVFRVLAGWVTWLK
jgi:hypothetical protein